MVTNMNGKPSFSVPALKPNAAAFVEAADAHRTLPPDSTPWRGQREQKPTETFLIRLTAQERGTLQAAFEQSRERSLQAFVRSILIPEITKRMV